jgi:hypothetical protein
MTMAPTLTPFPSSSLPQAQVQKTAKLKHSVADDWRTHMKGGINRPSEHCSIKTLLFQHQVQDTKWGST